MYFRQGLLHGRPIPPLEGLAQRRDEAPAKLRPRRAWRRTIQCWEGRASEAAESGSASLCSSDSARSWY
jgi:hypothetical protein